MQALRLTLTTLPIEFSNISRNWKSSAKNRVGSKKQAAHSRMISPASSSMPLMLSRFWEIRSKTSVMPKVSGLSAEVSLSGKLDMIVSSES
jgi:hypothetical protein